MFFVIDTGSTGPRARIKVIGLGVTYLPFALSSDASYADLPLALLGAPVDIGALVKPGSRSLGNAKTETGRAALPGQDHMYPFGIVGVAPRYIPARAVIELAGFRLSCTSTREDDIVYCVASA